MIETIIFFTAMPICMVIGYYWGLRVERARAQAAR